MEKGKKDSSKAESVFTRRFRAGRRRTYFFDVRPAKSNDYFLVITESKKRPDATYERYKIFLYKEDLKKFLQTFNETFEHMRTQLMPDFDFDAYDEPAAGSNDEERPAGGNADAPDERSQSEEEPPPSSQHSEGEEELRW
ncbi:MAG: DUF3276 family protein [Chitinophagales bacterium]|nr:PUR family DNA/RNA-binding protein [Chitinophagales bacterium]MDW8393551.1 DUF3276 family protein [Chitinophagales bacterium]